MTRAERDGPDRRAVDARNRLLEVVDNGRGVGDVEHAPDDARHGRDVVVEAAMRDGLGPRGQRHARRRLREDDVGDLLGSRQPEEPDQLQVLLEALLQSENLRGHGVFERAADEIEQRLAVRLQRVVVLLELVGHRVGREARDRLALRRSAA